MTKKFLFILCSILIAAGISAAQTAKKTITNDDLEKFRQSRLQAEKDLRENYAKLGFPSPEERDRQQEQARVERENLSDKLRQERLAREQFGLQRDYLRFQLENSGGVFVQNYNTGRDYPQIYSGYYFGGQFYPFRRFRQSGTYLPGGGYFGPTYNPNQGVQINTTPIRINTVGPTRPPVRIKPPGN